MDLIRKGFDKFYNRIKKPIFKLTEDNPEIAHEAFTLFCQFLYYSKLDKLVLDCKENKIDPGFKIFNAAGFNKDARMPPRVLHYLGFDGVVYGTVSGEEWKGNVKPRVARSVELESLSNYMGWNSEGVKRVARRESSYGNHGVPIVISVGATNDPALKDNLEARLNDVRKTILSLRGNPNVVEFDFNPSCSNLHISKEQFRQESGKFGKVIKESAYPHQKIGVKVSPDVLIEDVGQFIEETWDFADRYIIGNTTADEGLLRGYNLFNRLLKHPEKGVGSGRVVYGKRLKLQKEFYCRLKNTDKEIVACGGIDSKEKALESIEYEPQEEKEVRILTPLIFRGTKLLRELKK